MRTIIYPYKMGSQSARALSNVLNAVRVRAEGRYLPRRGDFIINWGASTTPAWFNAYRAIQGVRFLNLPEAVGNAANKLRAFRILHEAGVSIPDFTTDHHLAEEWVRNTVLYARRILSGHSGAGIEVISDRNHLFENGVAPLYVKAVENNGEYRVHVVNGRVIDYIKKRRRNDDRPTHEQNLIRNLDNGWVYTRQNLRRLQRVEDIAIAAVAALGLDFGAVDVINDNDGRVYVLEVNTACGMSDTTLNSYTEAFSELIENYNAS